MRLIISFTSSIFNINHDDTIEFDMILKNKHEYKKGHYLYSCLGYLLFNSDLTFLY